MGLWKKATRHLSPMMILGSKWCNHQLLLCMFLSLATVLFYWRGFLDKSVWYQLNLLSPTLILPVTLIQRHPLALELVLEAWGAGNMTVGGPLLPPLTWRSSRYAHGWSCILWNAALLKSRWWWHDVIASFFQEANFSPNGHKGGQGDTPPAILHSWQERCQLWQQVNCLLPRCGVPACTGLNFIKSALSP